ncbi:MAG: hypothetical protein JW889_04880 [Verrucomicrobia bacterium]|nr:hypothetical protein [Verrucomicrobiota bacterium]
MAARIFNTTRVRLLVLGLWTLLVVAVGAYHHLRFEVVRRAWWHEGSFPFYPAWLLFLDVLLIAAGFGLLSIGAITGRTRSQRFWYTSWVGFMCFAAAGNVVFDAWRQLLYTILN